MAAKKIVKKSTTVSEVAKPATKTDVSKTPPNKFQQVGKTKTLKGSILTPETGGLRLVLSVNNLKGDPKGNPLLPLFDKKWPKVKEESRGWYVNKTGAYKFGAIKDVAVQSDVWVMGLLCQGENFEVDHDGLLLCLKNLRKVAKDEKATVHVSSILTDLSSDLGDLLKSELIDQGVSVYFYTGDQK